MGTRNSSPHRVAVIVSRFLKLAKTRLLRSCSRKTKGTNLEIYQDNLKSLEFEKEKLTRSKPGFLSQVLKVLRCIWGMLRHKMGKLGVTLFLASFLYLQSPTPFYIPQSAFSGWQSFARECLLIHSLCSQAMAQGLKIGAKKVDPFLSWKRNRDQLSQIPVLNREMERLITFLERRWLAKINGYFTAETHWVCPLFGYSVQVHPKSTNSYIRDPATKASETYLDIVADWKKSLPHPTSYPLILTRPFDISKYLPSETSEMKVIDLTPFFPEEKKQWMAKWKEMRKSLLKEHQQIDRVICIQRLQENGIGGIRILPLSEKKIEHQHHYLLDWVSCFGLSANLIELDRFFCDSLKKCSATSLLEPVSLQESRVNLASAGILQNQSRSFCSYLDSFLQNWNPTHHEKKLLMKGVLKTVSGLLSAASEEKWNQLQKCPSRSSLITLFFSQIREQLQQVSQEPDTNPFFKTAAHIEEIHASLVGLLEIFSPFSFDDFPAIYNKCLTKIPPSLKEMAAYTIHSSGMTSVAAILQAARPKKVLYGENIYFECIRACNFLTQSVDITTATEKDLEEVDLIFAQFHPTWKRENHQRAAYFLEDINGIVRKALREGKNLTLALDGTVDYIDSEQMASLLKEFQGEIEQGLLNFICHRSGVKFDLFGMDNFTGAPLLMIHNGDPKWDAFDALIKDSCLQTDSLSFNWYCLAYQSAFDELEQYRGQIFANSRALLNQVPKRLLSDSKCRYQVVPISPDTHASFIDIRVFGPLHSMKAAMLVGGSIYLRGMQENYPMFYRRSFGFHHPNFGMLFNEKCSTVRLTLGLDTDQIALFTRCLEMIDALNES